MDSAHELELSRIPRPSNKLTRCGVSCLFKRDVPRMLASDELVYQPQSSWRGEAPKRSSQTTGTKRGSGQIRLQDAQLLGGSFLRLRFHLCPAFFHSF
jgi:hypothetical protein